ncbi:MAG TPA: hypothetical protein PKD55_14700 [Bellilinea sp.]|nr:hypothetical protein [Bellilinea sp.]
MKYSPSKPMSMITIVIDEGRGSEVMSYVRDRGAEGTVCFLGRGTVDNKVLHFLELDNVQKEIIMTYVPQEIEVQALQSLAGEFGLSEPRAGIAFAIPAIKPDDVHGGTPYRTSQCCVMVIVPEGSGEMSVKIARGLGINGATIVYAHGAASRTKRIFDLPIEAEKEIVLFVTEPSRIEELQAELTQGLHLNDRNSGVLAVFPVTGSVGLEDERAADGESTGGEYSTLGTAIVLHAQLGHDADFFHAADRVGSRGGTVIHARGVSAQVKDGLFGGIEPELEVLFIMTDGRHLDNILSAVTEVNGEMHVQPPQISLLPVIAQTGLRFED